MIIAKEKRSRIFALITIPRAWTYIFLHTKMFQKSWWLSAAPSDVFIGSVFLSLLFRSCISSFMFIITRITASITLSVSDVILKVTWTLDTFLTGIYIALHDINFCLYTYYIQLYILHIKEIFCTYFITPIWSFRDDFLVNAIHARTIRAIYTRFCSYKALADGIMHVIKHRL